MRKSLSWHVSVEARAVYVATTLVLGLACAAWPAAPPADVPADWWAQVQKDIAQSEYHITWQDRTLLPGLSQAYQAPNRAQNLRTYFTEAGPRVIRRDSEKPEWMWGLEFMGFDGGAPVPAVERVAVNGNRIELHRGGLVEWYVNSEAGLEQGFTIETNPDGGDALTINLAVRGDLTPGMMPDGETIEFLSAGGVGIIRYGHLEAYDATGRELCAGMGLEMSDRQPIIRLSVDAMGAVYPITIDPLAASASWTAESDQADAWFGASVSTAGDVNGDGYADVIVGAHFYDNWLTNQGRVYVYHGSASGLSAAANWAAESDQSSTLFGFSVSTAGDVNGDGYADVIVGAYGYTNGESNEGRAFVYHGSAGGLSATANWTAESDNRSAFFGISVSTAGDVNGDGYADVIVGARSDEDGQANEGRAFVWFGSATGLGANGTPANADWRAESDQAGAHFGRSVSTAGDVNGDGYADVIVGAPDYDNGQTKEGGAFVWFGSATGLGANGTPANADWGAESDQDGGYLGVSVSTAGDVNRDGYADVIVGASNYDNGQTDEGGAFVWFGSATGLGANGTPANANWSAESDQDGAFFGVSVSTAGDVNGDGYADVIVGAFFYDNGQTDEGRAYLYYGGPSSLSATPGWIAESDQAGAWFGVSVSAAGDVNGDGYADIIVGAEYYDNGESNEGRAYVYYGSAHWTAESDQTGAWLGYSVSTAGDVNGDGYADVIVGACGYDNGESNEGRAFVYHGSAFGPSPMPNWRAESNQDGAYFGIGVSTAGDVNGDGYADVIVGAPYYTNGQAYEGRAFVWFGSATGLGANGRPGNADWRAESNQAYAFFGWPVSTAGDVNGDGYADVIVAAGYYSNGEAYEGRAFVWFGSATGLGANGRPANADWSAESDQAVALLGRSAATAGDVNGDGYADVIVGAMLYNKGQADEGRAFVYHGSADGLSAAANWTAESDQANAELGRSVSTAGDVNGDGYADVIVGAALYDNGETDEGRAFVYFGSAGGLSAGANWTAEGNQGDAWFGYCVSTAGDVNGDGYADVIVGAPLYDNGETDEGRAHVYFGSAGVLSALTNWTAESDQANGELGRSVSTAGDVNGDGYADVIVGAPDYDNGQTKEGGAFVWFGSATGLGANGTPANADWTAESDQLGAWLGYSVSTAGDVNGDGYADVIAGAPWYDNGQVDEGRAFAWFGSATGLGANGTPANADWDAESDQGSAYYGVSVSTAGDVNGDGYADAIVGAYRYSNGQSQEGRAFVYHGSAGGLSATADWTGESDQVDADFGYSVATAGDVNGDAYADVIVGAPGYDNGEVDEGRAFVWFGSATGLGANGTPANADWGAESDQAGADFGVSVATAGDVNGDGYADVIVGAWDYDNGHPHEGRAFVYHGSAFGPSPMPNWTAEGDQGSAHFGVSAATAGDVNGDGYADVIIGAYYYTNGQLDEGRAFVYYGNGDAGPGLSLNPRQRRGDDTAPIAHLGMSESPPGARLAALGRTPFGRGKVKLECEAKPLGTPFDGTGTVQSAAWIDTGTAGAELNELLSGLSVDTVYHWRIRLLYNPVTTPYQQASRWFTMPWNGRTEADFRIVRDSTPPTALLECSAPDPVNNDILVDVNLSEASTDFTVADITPTNASVVGFSGSGEDYSFTLHPLSPGLFSCFVDVGTFHDAAGNANAVASNVIERTYDTTPPMALLQCSAPDPVNNDILVDVNLSEASTDFTVADIAPTNASVVGFSGSGEDYSFTLHPLSPGLFSCFVDVGTFHDAAGNANAVASNVIERTYDNTPPTATITLDDPTPTGANVVHFSVDFSESVGTSFDAFDVTVTGSLSGSSVVSGADPEYTVTVTPTQPDADGTVGIAVAGGGGVTDLAGNSYAGGASPLCEIFNWYGFTSEPEATRAYTGDDVSFTVMPDCGASTITYQWKWDDGTKTVHDGPATAAWDLASVTTANRGTYWCEVSYDGQTYPTASAALTVEDHLQITVPPENQAKLTGESCTFAVQTAGGYAPLTYVWSKDGETIPDATEPSYTLSDLNVDDSGTYTVEVVDAYTDVQTASAELEVTQGVPTAGFAGTVFLLGLFALGAARKLRGR